ncbi:MAG: hypothetical protein KF866_03335 [Phycisphaeraceae bacterium]|nr:hypothetical protein [Phycisphaeraceae bacterium]MCW5753270.1 hypothetical protein [Phycisphaeraceae bacterium]
MATPTCPTCKAMIAPEHVNVAADVMFCPACNRASKFSALVEDDPFAHVDLTNPPRGAWRFDDGVEMVIGASHRTVGGALVMLFMACFWNGIVSVFVLLCASAWWKLLGGGAAPGWMPTPIMNGSPMGWGMTIFLTLFLTPFVLIGLVLIVGFVHTLFGRSEVRVRGPEGTLFIGIGNIGRRKHFNAGAVRNVTIRTEEHRTSKGGRYSKTLIVLDAAGGEPITFGSSLRPDRRTFVGGSLREILVHPSQGAGRRISHVR